MKQNKNVEDLIKEALRVNPDMIILPVTGLRSAELPLIEEENKEKDGQE